MAKEKKFLPALKSKIRSLPSYVVQQFKEEFAGETWKSLLKNNLYVIFGAFIYAIGTSFFTVPMNVISGGLASIAIILERTLGGLDADTYILILNWGVFVIGLFVLGIKYSLKTLVFTLFNPLFIMLFTFLIENVQFEVNGEMLRVFDIREVQDIIVDSTLAIPADSLLPVAYLVAALFGGGIMGAGIGFALIGGGSSGGTDIINVTLHKYFRVKIGTSSLMCDVLIMLAGFFFTNDCNLLATMIGAGGAILCSVTLDMVFSSKNKSYVALIVSHRWVELNEYINKNVGRGTTLIKGQGGYSRLDTMVIEVCFDRRDYNMLERAVHKIDPEAFMTILKAQEILGYGFSRDSIRRGKLKPEEVDQVLIHGKKMPFLQQGEPNEERKTD